MAQSNFEERIDTYEIESTNVMTGDRDQSRYLYYQLKMSMAKAKQIDIIVSFLMESGVRMLLNDMKRALDRGVKIRILTGNYLGITQPSALYLIKSELGDRVDLRLYNETSRSFHPKSYIFHYESSNEIYIGSSNISKSALTSGIEWNYRFSDTLDKKNYELFYATFEDLFLNHSIIIDDEELKRYSKAWKKPSVSRDLAKYDTAEDNEDRNAENVRMLYRPRGAQIEALYALQESRMEGAAKGLVYAATGIGKTYLRLYKGKEYLNVLDFIGNYEKAGKAPLLLSGEQTFNKNESCEYQDLEYPDDCIVDFDMRLIDLFKEIDKKKLTLKMQIRQEYYRVKELLDGKRPSRMDLFTYMDDEIYRICVSGSHAKENPFQQYLDFLYELGELSEDEQKLYAGIGREFIQTIETTEMQKVYKMPILYSFYNHGNIRLAVTDEEVLESWKEFFDTGTNWKDFPNVNTYEDYKKVTDKQHLSKAKRMPIRFLKASGKGFFVEKDGYALALRDEIGDVVGNMAFGEQMGDVLGYRSLEYYRRRYKKNRSEGD